MGYESTIFQMVAFPGCGQCQGRRYKSLKKCKHRSDLSCDFSVSCQLTFFLLYGRVKKLAKLRKLHHDKTIKYDFFALLFKNGTLGFKIYIFILSGNIFKVVQKVLFIFFIMKVFLNLGGLFTRGKCRYKVFCCTLRLLKIQQIFFYRLLFHCPDMTNIYPFWITYDQKSVDIDVK